MTPRRLSITAGISYIVIFFAAIFANFFVLEAILKDPLQTIQQNDTIVRLGIFAFMLTVFFDVIVAWALFELYKSHQLSNLSTFFRLMHATIMGVALFTFPVALRLNDSQAILHQVDIFNIIWLIGLLFFGCHLIILASIIRKPGWIALFLALAGTMYIIDTLAHFMMRDYENYSTVFLAMVAIPSIVGEMSFAIWLLMKGGKGEVKS